MHNVEIFVRKAVGISKVLDLTDPATGLPFSLTGYAVWWSAKVKAGEGSAVVAASTSDGRIVISETPGQFHLAVPYTAFNAVAPGIYVHDCVLVAPDGAREVLFGGKMTVEASVTVPA